MAKVIAGTEEFGTLSEELLRSGTAVRFTARGSSMRPFILNGDILTIEPVDPAALQIGDVAFYRTAGNALAAHRVLGTFRRNGIPLLRIRGDAVARPDECVPFPHVLGRAVKLLRGRRSIRLDTHLQRQLGFAWASTQPLGTVLLLLGHKLKATVRRLTVRSTGCAA